MSQINFDATTVPPDPGRGDPVPAGWYNVAMEKSELKPTSSGEGNYLLECVFGILDGQYQGRKLWDRFNLRNNNPQAQEIAYKQFSALCHAAQHLRVGESSELHNRPLKVRVKVEPASADGKYEAKNSITAYKNINEQVGNGAATPAVAAPPQFAPPPVQNGWAPQPAMTAPPAQFQHPNQSPPVQPPQQPVQQPWAGAPAGPPQQPWNGTPAVQQPAAAPAGPPAWQPPAGAVQQPWAQAAPAAAPVAAPPMQPAPGPAQWSPAPAGVAAPATATPPWAQPKQ